MKKNILLMGLIIFLIACNPIPKEKRCTTESDCVAATCCHASGAVNKNYGRDCSGVLCTAHCEPNTLDCGSGNIQCVAGECTVVLT